MPAATVRISALSPNPDGEHAAERPVRGVNEHVFAELSLDFAGGHRFGDRTADGFVDRFERVRERAVGEDRDDECAGAHAQRRIVGDTDLHGEPFAR